MTAGKACSQENLTIKEVAEMCNKDVGTIRNWYIGNRQLFNIALIGCAITKLKVK